MKTSALLPVGTQSKQELKTISKGDILELCTGDKATFLEMKRTKFIAIINGKNMNVPIYRNHSSTYTVNKMNNTPFILKVIGKDESVITKSSDINKFKPGQLFALETNKETFMFVENQLNDKIAALDLATGKLFTIRGSDFKIIKVDVDKMKRELISK